MDAKIILKKYLRDEGISVISLASAIGVGRQAVYSWLNGTKKPSDDNKRDIFNFTNGNVQPNHWCEVSPNSAVRPTRKQAASKEIRT